MFVLYAQNTVNQTARMVLILTVHAFPQWLGKLVRPALGLHALPQHLLKIETYHSRVGLTCVLLTKLTSRLAWSMRQIRHVFNAALHACPTGALPAKRSLAYWSW